MAIRLGLKLNNIIGESKLMFALFLCRKKEVLRMKCRDPCTNWEV